MNSTAIVTPHKFVDTPIQEHQKRHSVPVLQSLKGDSLPLMKPIIYKAQRVGIVLLLLDKNNAVPKDKI